MARPLKGGATRSVSFRMPASTYADLMTVAEARGVDLSALLNWCVHEYRPTLLEKQAALERATLAAAASRLPEALAGGEVAEAQQLVRTLLKSLHDLNAALAKQALDREVGRTARRQPRDAA